MIEIMPVRLAAEVAPGDDIAGMIAGTVPVRDDDVIVVAQKIVSKAEGRLVALDGVRPGLLARGLAGEYGKDPRVLELVLREAETILRMGRGVIITQRRDGHVCANSGVDVSNVPEGHALLLPEDSDASARRIRDAVEGRLGVKVGVIISDTAGRPFRLGQTDVCLGCSGVGPLLDYAGTADTHGRIMRVSVTAVADQLAGAAELAMKKAANTPAAVLRGSGCVAGGGGSGADLIRRRDDLFK